MTECVGGPTLEDSLNNFIFPLTVLLAQGKRLELMPWHLGAPYSGLDECAKNVICSVGWYDIVSYADVNFLQLFL